MKFFIKKIFDGESAEEAHQNFVRYGKGSYKKRFMMNINKGNKIKVRTSFELANELVKFVKENKELKFSGKILTKEKIFGKDAKKKGGCFVYEVSESSIEEFENVYFYLLNATCDDIVLKIKKSLPKPGKSENKIDDKFCSLDLDIKYWPKVKEIFFWDLPQKVKKAKIEHELLITDILIPEGEDDPKKIRALAKRKGKIIRKLEIDGKEETKEKEFVI